MKPIMSELVRQGRVEEFKALREQALYALRSRVWGLATYAALTFGSFGLIGKDSTGICALVVLLLALPFAWYTTYIERIRCRISAYIHSVIEPEVPGMTWEGYLSHWRQSIHEEQGWRRGIGRWRYILSILGVYDIVSALCLWLVWENGPLWAAVAASAAALLVAHDHMRLDRILCATERYRDIFRHKHESDV